MSNRVATFTLYGREYIELCRSYGGAASDAKARILPPSYCPRKTPAFSRSFIIFTKTISSLREETLSFM